MSYIGNTPTTQSFISGTDSFNGTGSATNFTLSRFVNSVNDIQVVVNNVVQYPPNYSVSGTTLTISPAPSSGTNNVYVRYLSTTLQSIGVSQGSTIQFGPGAVGSPSITFSNDTNTGIYSPAADTLAFVEGGTEVMRIDTSGNVGIGTSSQTWDEKLAVRLASSGAGTVGLGVYSASTSYTGALVRVQSENSTGANYKLYEGRGSGGSVNYWVDGAGNGYFAGNLQFNSGYGSVATAYGCRAWVNFNGTGTVAIRGSANVTSITDTGTGDYTVNFTTAMPDANYCTNVTGTHDSGSYVAWGTVANDQPPTTTNVNVDFLTTNGTLTDVSFAEVSIFR